METKKLHFETLQLHVGQEQPDPATDARAVPIYQTTSYVFRNSAHAAARFGLQDPGNIYGRLTNSTQGVFEARVAALEGGVAGLAVASGAAAVTYALENITRAGDHIVSAKTIYGGTYNLLEHTLPAYGVTTTFVDPADLSNFEKAIQENTKAVYIETPTNPMIEITDIRAVSNMAHDRNALVIVDNTFLSPYFQKPLNLGADIVVHSGTKFIGGHHDVISGFTIVNDESLAAQLRLVYKTVGACLSAFDSWLVIRGIKTLALRMEQHQKNAIAIAEWLKQEPKVTKVLFHP